MLESDMCYIRVSPLSDQLLVRVAVMPETLGGIVIPATKKYDEFFRRAKVLAIGPDVKDLKVGDMIYLPAPAGAEVEVLAAMRDTKKEYGGACFLVHRKDLAAKIEFVGKENLNESNVVVGLSDRKQQMLQKEKVEHVQGAKTRQALNLKN